MRTKLFALVCAALLLIEVAAVALCMVFMPSLGQDTVAVNDLMRSVSAGWERGEFPAAAFDYTVVGADGRVLFASREGLSLTENDAIMRRDTILDVRSGERVVGQVYIANPVAGQIRSYAGRLVAVLASALALQIFFAAAYLFYLDRRLVRPFQKLRAFAVRVAGGNLDLPLDMDRGNAFGAFTESFDLMRDELKKAREAEAAANASKKELVAKLSHDIKTPVASIRAVAETASLSAGKAARASLGIIQAKADQIDALVSNLFHATLEELRQLTVSPADHDSRLLVEMTKNADYLGRASVGPVPQCLLRFDKMRLQQVLDNVVSNSYKYAATPVAVTFSMCAGRLDIRVEDEGGGVDPAEIDSIFEKFRRGKNAAGKEGAGLGLYISRWLMRESGGDVRAENTGRGLAVTVSVPLAG